MDVEPRWKQGKARRSGDRERRRYPAWRTEQLEARRFCEAGDPGGMCRLVSDQLHHRRRRSRGGALCSVVNTVASCEPCHVWIHGHPEEAAGLGLLVREGDPDWVACGERGR